jgi:hypothetical protein
MPDDVFSIETSPSGLEVLINGVSRGRVATPQGTLKEFAVSQARTYGIRTFSVYADGQKLTEADAGRAVSGVLRLEIVAKDSRG